MSSKKSEESVVGPGYPCSQTRMGESLFVGGDQSWVVLDLEVMDEWGEMWKMGFLSDSPLRWGHSIWLLFSKEN